MNRPFSPGVHSASGFSLVELLVVVGVISIITTVAVQAIVFTRGTALESVMAAQEHSINTSYRAIKANATSPLPSSEEQIIELIESDPRVGFPIPRTMEGSEGTCALRFDAQSELFSYVPIPEESAPLVSVN